MSKADKVALVTGGSSGIGAQVVSDLAADGFTVLNLALDHPDLDPPVVYQPTAGAGSVIPITVDLSDTRATAQVAEELAARYPITRIIHNAGTIREKPLAQVTQDDFDALANLHLSAPITLVRANLNTMRDAGFGRIVLMSTRAVLGLANRTVYSATKAGLLGLARTWALEFAADGITCNVVCPGPIAGTAMFHDLVPEGSEKMDQIAQSVPVKRIGRPQDVSRAVQFFIADEADFVTGQTLFVCGGTSVGSITY
ncbi:MAG: SDR family oxidoreductase [Burkholderiaceae bacterium]